MSSSAVSSVEAGLAAPRETATVDAVIVAFNSRRTLRDCVAPLSTMSDVDVTVVDNASPDDSPAVLEGLSARVIRAPSNGGFASGCNLGSIGGRAPYVLLLNPDAVIDAASVRALVRCLDADPRLALAAPRLLRPGGGLAFSQRRFARLRSTWARALFLHRLWPAVSWTDELVRTREDYERRATPDWVSGACMLIRRDALREIGGLDERFFLYCEDMDLCRRLREAGHEIAFEPAAVARHIGGASSRSGDTLPINARSRVAYARRHYAPAAVPLERAGIAFEAATHVLSSLGRPNRRRGHAAALRTVLRGEG